MKNCNCIVCAREFEPDELQNIVLSKINSTDFKICEGCLNISDPENDYEQVRGIVDSYLNSGAHKHLSVKSLLKAIGQ